MNTINVKPRSIGRQFDIEKVAAELRAEGKQVIIVSDKTKSDNNRGKRMNSNIVRMVNEIMGNGNPFE